MPSLSRNLLDKVSKPDQEEVKRDSRAILNRIEAAPGEPALGVVGQRALACSEKWRSRYPGAVDCWDTNLGALTAHLHFPKEHWERARHSNLVERTFGESRRRVKVIGRLPGEPACLWLVWAVLDRASVGWRGLDTSVGGIRQLLSPPTLAATG